MKIQTIFRASVLFLLAILTFIIPNISHAETYVNAGDLNNGGNWVKERSPYILNEDIYVPKEVNLNINPGVIVMSASSTPMNRGPFTLTFDSSNLTINGSINDPVKIYDLYSLYFSHSILSIKNAILQNTGIDLLQSTSTIEGVTIKDSNRAIRTLASFIDIKKSKLINNQYGIDSQKYSTGPFLMYEYSDKENTGGLGNALEGVVDIVLDPKQNIIRISESNIMGNKQYGIYNRAPNPISAENNYWGSKNGPRTEVWGEGDRIYGLMNTVPWRDIPIDEVECCSSVLFLPGIEASRLYKDNRQILGTSTIKLWEPFGNSNLKNLAMDINGQSLDNTIYTKDIIDSAYGVKNIYKSFIAMMNSVVAEKIINEWLTFPYDWRMNVNDIVNSKIIDSIERLAKNSKTGKVIIIAHSNGGLIAKALMQTLEKENKANIVERIINIAVPELGTPKAILSMLHGYDQSIGMGLLASEKSIRDLSQNMLGAYGLLPSKKFFEINPIAVISDYFSNDSGIFANSYESMKNFLVSNSFSEATSTNKKIPLLLNSNMMNMSDFLHSTIDYWKNSTSTNTISLIGWGLPTANGVVYENDTHCNKLKEDCIPGTKLISTDRGDGTVLVDSNAKTSNESLFLNLKKLNNNTNSNINHANILEATETLGLIKKQVSNTKPDNDYGEYITSSEPIDTDTYLTIEIYSPVDINIYDKEGRHTGLIENYDPYKDFYNYETKIKSSYYTEFNDVKIIKVPYGPEYNILLSGNDAGYVIVKAEISQFDKVIASTTFSEMPVTPLLNAELIISTSTKSFATSSIMNMDIDGDGVADFVNHTDIYLKNSSEGPIKDYITYIESIKKIVLALKLSDKEEKVWINRIDKIIKKIQKNHIGKIDKIIKKLEKKKFKNSSLDQDQKQAILNMLNKVLNYLENTEK